jgi:DNA repair exonuclease SbcCD ATPase subunit
MKIQSLQLKYFKKFRSSPLFDFTDPETGLARDIIVLIGMNGAGKTSLLQAIASGGRSAPSPPLSAQQPDA